MAEFVLRSVVHCFFLDRIKGAGLPRITRIGGAREKFDALIRCFQASPVRADVDLAGLIRSNIRRRRSRNDPCSARSCTDRWQSPYRKHRSATRHARSKSYFDVRRRRRVDAAGDLLTLRQLNLPVKVVVFRKDSLALHSASRRKSITPHALPIHRIFEEILAGRCPRAAIFPREDGWQCVKPFGHEETSSPKKYSNIL